MTTSSQGIVVAGVHGGVVQFSVGTDPQHHFASHGQVSRKLAEVADTTSGTVWVGCVTGAWLDESDLQTLEAAIQNARTNQDDLAHVYVPDWTNEGRCHHCEALPGHCTGGAA